jgi:hypothetical protein
LGSRGIDLFALNVLSAVKLNYETILQAYEVYDVASYWLLPAKLVVTQSYHDEAFELFRLILAFALVYR